MLDVYAIVERMWANAWLQRLVDQPADRRAIPLDPEEEYPMEYCYYCAKMENESRDFAYRCSSCGRFGHGVMVDPNGHYSHCFALHVCEPND